MVIKKINPLDNIILTNNVIGTLKFITKNGTLKSTKPIQLPEGTHLISSESNYKIDNEYLFYFGKQTQYQTFKNLYMYNEIRDKSIVGFRLSIYFELIENDFETKSKFDYAELNPYNKKHVSLLIRILLNDDCQTVAINKWLLFISDFDDILKIKDAYKNCLLTFEQAYHIILTKIFMQINANKN